MKKFTPRFVILVLITLVLVSTVSAFAAMNTVPVTRIGQVINSVTANALKPSQCSAQNLTKIVICSGAATCNGTNAKELILGTANAEKIQGSGGTDCILGGGGDDQLVGNGANDICIGGPGTDTFTTCETQIQ